MLFRSYLWDAVIYVKCINIGLKKRNIIHIIQCVFLVPKIPSSKDGYFCAHSGQKMPHFRDKDAPGYYHDLQKKELAFV